MKVKLDPGAYMPERAHADDAGLDLRSMEDAFVYSGEHRMFDTGVHVAIPNGYFGLVASKSGLMGKGMTSRGIIRKLLFPACKHLFSLYSPLKCVWDIYIPVYETHPRFSPYPP